MRVFWTIKFHSIFCTLWNALIEIFHFKIYVDIGWKLANIHSDDFDSCYLAKHTVVDEL